MFFRRVRREVPGLNTTSTADISFMLLIFFLVTTSMDTDKGMGAHLPPPQPEKHEVMNIDRTKVLTIHIYEGGMLSVGSDSSRVALSPEVREVIKKHIVTIGPSHVIEIHADGNCDYDTYFALQNEIARSYREICEAAAKHRFGKTYSFCTEEEKEQLNTMFPQRIHESY